MENNTQVYEHRRLDTNEIFYVGIGGGDRPWDTGGRNKFWRRVVKKAGYSVEVVADQCTWGEACEIEKMLIALYGRRDLGFGPLVNLTDGGDGTPGIQVSPETRAKLSAAAQNISPEHRAKMGAAQKGRTTSLETRAKISAAKKGKTPLNKGTTHSPEARAKMSAAQKGRTTSPETRAKLSAARKAYYEAKKLQ